MFHHRFECARQRPAPCVSASTSCTTSTPAAPTVATPAAPPPFSVRLSANASRTGGVSPANELARFGKRSPQVRAGEIDMDEAGARVEAEALEADRARRRLEGLGVVVRHGDVESDAFHVLRRLRPADGTVVLGAPIGRAQDQWLAEPVAQGLQLV